MKQKKGIYRVAAWLRGADGRLHRKALGATRDAGRARRMASSAPISSRVLDFSAWGDGGKR